MKNGEETLLKAVKPGTKGEQGYLLKSEKNLSDHVAKNRTVQHNRLQGPSERGEKGI